MNKEKAKIMVGFRVTESFRNKITLAAQKEGRSIQEMITRAIVTYLNGK